MNDISALQDALIADEIERLSYLSRQEIMRELIEVKSRAIENASLPELLKLCKSKKHDD